MNRIGACLLVAVLSAPAALVAQSPTSGDWVQIAENDQGRIFLDRRTREVRGNLATAWFRTDLRQTGSNGEDIWMDRRQVDCSAHRIRLLALAEYKSDGSVLHSISVDEERWTDIPAGTVAAIMERLLCG